MLSASGRPGIWTRYPVLCSWAFWALVLLAIFEPSIAAFRARDPDDFMRLLEVRDWLDGQGWFDVTQYRMNPPAGAAMHWSRLVDIPIAALLVLFRPLLGEPAASIAAMTLVPLLQLLLAMALIRAIMRELGADKFLTLAATALLPTFPLVLSTFAPLRIDHHGWQAIAALACGYLLTRAPAPRAAVTAGLVAALWLSISLEGLPLVTALAAIYGLRFCVLRDRSVSPFLAGLAAGCWLVQLATRPLQTIFTAQCDALGWPHLAAFSLAAVLTALIARSTLPGGRTGRVVALGLAGAVAAPLIIAPLGLCSVSPFAELDPLLRLYWYDKITEGLPVWMQRPSMIVMQLWVPATVLYALYLRRDLAEWSSIGLKWRMLALYTLVACALSLLVAREAIVAQALSVPFAAAIISHWLPRARRIRGAVKRALVSAGVIIVATPVLAVAMAKPLDRPARSARSNPAPTGAMQPCDLAELDRLPPSRLFTTFDPGPEILVKTRHTVVIGSYHRNPVPMRDVIEAFSGTPQNAEALVRSYGSAYVVLCMDAGDTAVLRKRRPDNLANQLAAGKPPLWLERVPGFDNGTLRVFRVK